MGLLNAKILNEVDEEFRLIASGKFGFHKRYVVKAITVVLESWIKGDERLLGDEE